MAHDYVFHYLFYRGISIAVILIVYLFIREGLSFYKNFFKVGISGFLGGIFLSTAFIGFIFSITMTTAAVTLFMLAVNAFYSSYCWLILFLEKILRPTTLVSMIIAFIGVCVMIL